MLSPAPDLDADGIGDVVVAAQHQAWLVAVSGASGELLWVAPRGTDVKTGPPAPAGSGVTSASLGIRALGDVNNDGVSDVLVTFIDAEQLVLQTEQEHPQRWVEAVCGKTGATLWRHHLMSEGFQGRGLPELEDDVPYDFRWFHGADPVQYQSLRNDESSRFLHRIGVDTPSMSGERRDRAGASFCWAPAPAERIMLGRQPVVMILAGTRVVLLEPSSGEPAQSPQDLSFAPARAPKLADLDSDGTPELILIDQARKRMADNVGRGVASDPDEQSHSLARLVTWSLSHAKELSSRECHSLWGMYYYWFCSQPDWPLVSDLNADGKLELLVPDGSTQLVGGNELKREKWYNGKPGGGLSVLDGTTCGRFWARRLCSTHQQLDHFIVGPDIDADGWRDVFIATQSGKENYLYVDALSGKTGKAIWWTRQQLAPANSDTVVPIGRLRWWNSGPDGWPQLMVPVFSLNNRYERIPGVFLFSSRDGTLNSYGPDLEFPQLGDADGDGLADLFTFRPNSRESLDDGGRLDVVRGLPPETWRTVGASWSVADDVDGDGVADLVGRGSPSQLTAVSGTTRRVIWQKKLAAGREFLRNDFDGDGANDLLVHYSDRLRDRTPIRVVSGRTGRWLRRIDIHDANVHVADSHNLNPHAEGPPEVILLHSTPSDDRRYPFNICVSVVAGTTGKLLWSRPILYLRLQQEAPVYADLNGDGVIDLLLPAEIDTDTASSGKDLAAQALSGRDGHVLWQHRLTVSGIVSRRYRHPLSNGSRPLASDIDGDGQSEVVVLDWAWRQPELIAQLAILDGRTGQPKHRPFEITVPTIPSHARQDPLLVALDRDNRQGIFIALNTEGTGDDDSSGDGEFVEGFLIGGDGQLISRFPLARDTDAWSVRVFDTAGDGRDELIVLGDEAVESRNLPSGDVAWRWQLPSTSPVSGSAAVASDPPAQFLDFLAGNNVTSASIAIRLGNRVYGLSAADGKLVWNCDNESSLFRSQTETPTVKLMPGSTPDRPQVLYQIAERIFARQHRHAVVRQAVPATNPFGDMTLPDYATTTASPPGLKPDARLLRPLRWVEPIRYVCTSFAAEFLLGCACVITVVIVPGYVTCRLLQHRRFSAKELFSTVAVIALALAVLFGSPVIIPGEPLSIGDRLLYAMAALPVFALAEMCRRLVSQRKWRELVKWQVFLAGIAVWIAAASFASHLRELAPGETYSWQGWYLIFLPAAYFTGVVLLLVGLVGFAWIACRRVFRWLARDRGSISV